MSEEQQQQQQPLEIGVLKRDAHSFTIEATNDRLKKLLKEHKTIRTFDLRNNDNMVRIRISRNVKLKSRKDLRFTRELEASAIENQLYPGTTIEYERLD
jgi:hypothetical protein